MCSKAQCIHRASIRCKMHSYTMDRACCRSLHVSDQRSTGKASSSLTVDFSFEDSILCELCPRHLGRRLVRRVVFSTMSHAHDNLSALQIVASDYPLPAQASNVPLTDQTLLASRFVYIYLQSRPIASSSEMYHHPNTNPAGTGTHVVYGFAAPGQPALQMQLYQQQQQQQSAIAAALRAKAAQEAQAAAFARAQQPPHFYYHPGTNQHPATTNGGGGHQFHYQSSGGSQPIQIPGTMQKNPHGSYQQPPAMSTAGAQGWAGYSGVHASGGYMSQGVVKNHAILPVQGVAQRNWAQQWPHQGTQSRGSNSQGKRS